MVQGEGAARQAEEMGAGRDRLMRGLQAGRPSGTVGESVPQTETATWKVAGKSAGSWYSAKNL